MTSFYNEILNVVTEGLSTLVAAQDAGKTQKNPVSETVFLSAWVTKMIKQQRFDHCVSKTLLQWQKQSRTMGKNAQLKVQFERIKNTLSALNDTNAKSTTINAELIESFYRVLEQADWLITNEYEVNRKVSHHTDGQASLVVCAAQYKQSIDEQGALVKPLSFYVRGNTQQFIDLAYQQGVLLYKITDYKSKVKFHGEFVIYPDNAGSQLPELPTVAN
ncbi:DUF2913 family protein [Photobacterium leiognathi]|uniref:DUF2913 family protein n=1 Tax=Photobacterium leiognathi TaxID=553611 RepID=UPI002736589D|nr:DUF2913 family protein [Photobacterium leiognathi]